MSETLALGDRFRWLAFFAQHMSLLPALLGLFQEWQAATTIDAKAEVLKSLIDLLKGVVGEIPTGEAVIEGDMAALVATEELKFDGHILKGLAENLPQIISLVTMLAGLFGK